MPWSAKKPSAADIAPDWLLPYCKQFMQELIKQATGKPLTAAAYLRYLESKYLEVP